MKTLSTFLVALALCGCVPLPPVQIRSAPLPSAQEVEQVRAGQTRVVAVPYDAVFPGVLDVLMDNGFIIRSADKATGLVAFYQQWADEWQHGAIIAVEGSALFRPAGPDSTRVRLILTGGSQRLEVTGGGPRSSDSSMVGSAQQNASPGEYKKILEALEAGLVAGKAKSGTQGG